MKLRHAAALALAGWYLMIPPKRWLAGADIPLSKWIILNSFDSADECEASAVSLMDKEKKKNKPNPGMETWRAATCIATDDPRLREK